jgi:hypothetical protein
VERAKKIPQGMQNKLKKLKKAHKLGELLNEIVLREDEEDAPKPASNAENGPKDAPKGSIKGLLSALGGVKKDSVVANKSPLSAH